jgi:hypothetical protein
VGVTIDRPRFRWTGSGSFSDGRGRRNGTPAPHATSEPPSLQMDRESVHPSNGRRYRLASGKKPRIDQPVDH